jgi:hypothetical protein
VIITLEHLESKGNIDLVELSLLGTGVCQCAAKIALQQFC